jgi:5'-3' exonuclease
MGIPKFFYYVYQNYPQIISQHKTNDNINKDVDFLYFDLNAIIHPICQQVFQYGSNVQKSILFKKNINISKKIEEVFEKLTLSIEQFINMCQPKKGIYIAIDGVAGMSKCMQQRSRRFKSAMTTSESNMKFDPNCISTGTVFMDRLSKHISNFLGQKITSDWSHLELILSNEKVVGEGEHKIIRHIKDNSHLNSIILSPDADLFMLLLSCHNFNYDRKLYIIRQNIYDNIDCDYFVVDVNKLANIIIERVSKETNNIRKSEIITDFVFFSFF